MRRLLPFLCLAACAEFPALDARIPAADRAPPPLLPLGPLLAAADALPREPAFVPALRAEAAALQGRAAAPGPGLAGSDLAARAADLTARATALPAAPAGSADAQRLADLAARAEALRDAGLSEPERQRLLDGPAAP